MPNNALEPGRFPPRLHTTTGKLGPGSGHEHRSAISLMTQIALFLISVFGVTWTLLLVLRSVAAQGELWTVLAWILPTVWSPTIIALVLTRSMEGARCGKKRNQGATELPARFGSMAPTRGYRATIGNGDCGVHRARGRRRESVYPVSRDSGDVCHSACHRRCRRGAWLARLPAASPRQTIWRDDSSVGDGNPMESVARGRLLCSRHAAHRSCHHCRLSSSLLCSESSWRSCSIEQASPCSPRSWLTCR